MMFVIFCRCFVCGFVESLVEMVCIGKVKFKSEGFDWYCGCV